jgi:hypothetical protein
VRRTALSAALALALVPSADSSTPSSGERALQTVRSLAAIGARPAGSAAEKNAGDLVRKRLSAHGYRVSLQPFPLPRGGESRNVVALPRGAIRAIVTAHLDGVRHGPAANDNASGVAVMLELARAFGPERGILFAALGAEERAETGSDAHLGSVRLLRGFSTAGRRRIQVALNLDMVGVGARLHVRGIEPTPNRSARLAFAAASRAGLSVTYLTDPGWSDHAELSRAHIPAAWIQWREDSCWHRACDVPERVSPAKLTAAWDLVSQTLTAALPGR